MNGRFTAIPYLFLAPAIGLLLVFFMLPVGAAFILSFTDFDLYAMGDPTAWRWIGADNYLKLIGDPVVLQAFKNTAYFVLVATPLSVGASLVAALALDAKMVRFKSLIRLGFFAPVVTTLVAVAVVWRYLYHPTYGLLNWALSLVGVSPIDWLGNPNWAMPALIMMAVWKNFGYNMLIYLAGLQNVPAELREAARLDGAGVWAEFRHITVPNLMPTTNFIVVMTIIGYCQFFAEPYVMTNGGPLNQTLSVVLLMYREGFRFWRLGYAAALAFVLFAVVLAISSLSIVLRRKEAK
ncbi:MAG: sugar ABC transporter permease [Candidatus Sericytochromatia bacterium]|nr:sugar ABC transporter permease [Candidatus Sericytochromatia bacterium]